MGEPTHALIEFVDIYPTLIDYAGLKAPHHLSGESLRPVLDNPKLKGKKAAYTQVNRGKTVGRSVRVSFSPADGSAFYFPRRVDEGASDGRGDCAFLPDGSLLVGWMGREEGRVAWFLRRVWPDGTLGAIHALAEVAGDRDAGFLRLAVADGFAWALWTEPGAEKRVQVAKMSVR